jgi:tetratricopeptide (TPR) repeat protein
VLTAPAHTVTVIATTRVTPTVLLAVEPARQRQLPLDKGLGSPDAQNVLRELDDDGRLGLRDAPDDLLDDLRRHTRGFPRALEAVKAILDGDPILTPHDLLDRTRDLPEDRVVQVLVGDAYELLDGPGKQVMQALAVYPAPVSAVGVDFLLRPVNPTTDAASILARLVRRQLVRFHNGLYHLHPVDRDYARGQLPAGGPGDAPAAFTLTGLQARAADYYTQIRTPRESWRSLDDVRPQLAEFELRCDTGDYDAAATVLQDIDFDYLQVWGHYRTLIGLHQRIDGRVTNPVLNAAHLANLGYCHAGLGEYRQAINLHTQALAIARDLGHRRLEGTALDGLGGCHYRLGEYRQAIGLHTRALAIARDFGDRRLEGNALGNLGNCHSRLGEYRQAIDLRTQALAIFREIGDRQGESKQLGNLGNCRSSLGEYGQAIELHNQALAIARDTGNRRLEGVDLGNLGNCHSRLGDYQQAIELDNQALAIARDIGNRYGEANALDYLGQAWLASGNPRRATTLLEQAVVIAGDTSDVVPAVRARSGLARAQLQLDDPAAALATATAGRELAYPSEAPMIQLLEGLALLELDRADDSVRAFSDALAAADALLALVGSNVAALQARALALAGLAAANDDPARAAEAAEAFTRAQTVTTAAGVAADTHRLLQMIAAQDQSGVLTGLSPPQNLS